MKGRFYAANFGLLLIPFEVSLNNKSIENWEKIGILLTKLNYECIIIDPFCQT